MERQRALGVTHLAVGAPDDFDLQILPSDADVLQNGRVSDGMHMKM